MTRKKNLLEPAKMGRPVLEIDYSLFEGLCRIQCTLPEIAGCLGVSEDTVERRCKEHYGETFAETFKKHSAPGLMSLRRNQFRMAETNPTMAIWLGKQHLGQSDKVESKETVIVTTLTDEERASRAAEMLERGRARLRLLKPTGTNGNGNHHP